MFMFELAVLYIIFQYGDFKYKQNEHLQKQKKNKKTAFITPLNKILSSFIDIAPAVPYFWKK